MIEHDRNKVLDALLLVLSLDSSTRIQDRKSISTICTELGFTNTELADAWKKLKTQNHGKTILESKTQLTKPEFVLVLSCLAQEQNINNNVKNGLKSLAANIQDGPAVLEKFVTDLSELTQISFGQRQTYLTENNFARPNKKPVSLDQESLYIANQISDEGFDELQRLFMAHELGLHVALDGPPGVGKTQSIIEITNLLGKELHTKNCSTRTTEAHIIASPVLKSEDGVSVTDYQNGPLARALETGNVFYGDEFNLLKEDVQKRLNSAFDDRRSIDRPDGHMLRAKDGYWSVISYNPSDTLSSRDLEESVADRFIHMHYHRWDPDFKAWVAFHKAKRTKRSKVSNSNQFGIELSWRGIDPSIGKFYRAVEENGKRVWKDFFTNTTTTDEPAYQYLVCDQTSMFRQGDEKLEKTLAVLGDQAYNELELARLIARFTEILYSISTEGDAPLLKKIGLGNLREKEDLELLRVHLGSTRIEMAAAKTFQWLCRNACNKFLAQSYAVKLVIDQACYGQYRNHKLRETSSYELVKAIAKSMRLIANGIQFNTSFKPENLLKKDTKE